MVLEEEDLDSEDGNEGLPKQWKPRRDADAQVSSTFKGKKCYHLDGI